jgi:hypothetical protein
VQTCNNGGAENAWLLSQSISIVNKYEWDDRGQRSANEKTRADAHRDQRVAMVFVVFFGGCELKPYASIPV